MNTSFINAGNTAQTLEESLDAVMQQGDALSCPLYEGENVNGKV